MEHTVTHKFSFAYRGHDIRWFHPGDKISDVDEAFPTARVERWVDGLDDVVWPPIPRLYPGETIACVASGPSLTQSDVDRLKGRVRVIVVNDNHRLAPWADLLYAADEAWWNEYQGVPGFPGFKCTFSIPAAARWGLIRLPGERTGQGLSHDPMRIFQGGNSGYAAINIAWLLGAKRILLLGYDMQDTLGQKHWFGDHPKSLRNGGQYGRWLPRFATIPATLKGVEVLNCTRMSALNCFPRATLEEVLP